MKLVIPNEVYQKIMYWVHKADFEVSGMGNVTYNPETKEFLVHDACLVKQVGSGASTDIDSTALAKAMYDMRNHPGQLSFWWHSHVNMNVFMSGTDKDTCKQLGSNGYCMAAVFNKRAQIKTALAYKQVVNTEFGLSELTTHYMEDIAYEIRTQAMSHELIAQLDREYTDKVQERTYPMHGGHGKWNSSDYWDKWDDYDREKKVGKYTGSYSEWLDEQERAGLITKKEKKKALKGATKAGPSQLLLTQGSKGYDLATTEEAKALGMTAEKYLDLIDKATPSELADIDYRVNQYFKDKYGYSYYSEEI